MNETAHRKLLALQKRIYKSLQSEARRLMGPSPAAIQRYSREYREDFRGISGKPRVVSRSKLIRAIREADVSFVADFHTFPQAQKTAIRLLREAIRPGERWYIGLELIPSQFQGALDAYQAGRISLEKFHQLIRYSEEWGFPWANYAPIFEWARKRKIRLIALNQPREILTTIETARHAKELHERDRWAAGIITDLFHLEGRSGRRPRRRPQKKRPQRKRPRMLVLYGELHVGKNHLPAQLNRISRSYMKKSLRWLTIHQNVDEIYWKLAQRHLELRSEVVQLDKQAFCVLPSTPWTKLQSLVSWIEEEHAARDPDTFAEEGELDYFSWVQTYCCIISEFLGLEAPSFESLSIKTIYEANFMEALKQHFKKAELQLIKLHVLSNQTLYLPHVEIAYLGTPSQNRAAELAAIHLIRKKTGTRPLLEPRSDDFFRLILESSFGFFGSLIINPKRKCDLVEDHARRLSELKAGAKERFPSERKARAMAWDVLGGKASFGGLNSLMKTSPYALMTASQMIGHVLGKKLYQSLIDETVSVEWIRKQYFSILPRSKISFEHRYLQLLRAIGRSTVDRSKTDHL